MTCCCASPTRSRWLRRSMPLPATRSSCLTQRWSKCAWRRIRCRCSSRLDRSGRRPSPRRPTAAPRWSCCRSDAGGGHQNAERTARVSLVGPEVTLGELCVASRGDRPLSDREWRFVNCIAELAVIAISSARMRERERQVAILAERERLAREMHDSLAQVLGYIHLQLVALRPKVGRGRAACRCGKPGRADRRRPGRLPRRP